MRHIPNNKNSSTARISGDGNQKQESKDSDNLIQKLQSEIVSLEEKLLESENQILALQNKDEHVDEEENESQVFVRRNVILTDYNMVERAIHGLIAA